MVNMENTSIMIPCSGILLEKLLVAKLASKFPASYGILGQMNPVHTSHPIF
jgi:hypothetical protein